MIEDFNSTFNLPDFTNRTPWQSATMDLGLKGNGNLPNITGSTGFSVTVPISGATQGAFAPSVVTSVGVTSAGNAQGSGIISFDASQSNAIYSGVDRVVPAWVSTKWAIKY